MKTSSGKNLEDISHVHIVSLMFKLIASNRGSDILSFGFDRNRGRRKDELTNNRNMKGKYPFRIILKDVFGFAEHQEIATYYFGDKLTLTGNEDEAVIENVVVLADARIKIDHIHWYVPHYTLSIQQKGIL